MVATAANPRKGLMLSGHWGWITAAGGGAMGPVA